MRAAARERKGRDPRFDRLSGKLSEDLFEKSYSWMTDVAQRDAKELRDLASKEKDADSRAQILVQAARIEQKLKQDARKSEDTKLKRQRKKAMMDVAASTGKAFWLKKRELRQIEIARKYEALKAKGKGAVDDYGECYETASCARFLLPPVAIKRPPPPTPRLQLTTQHIFNDFSVAKKRKRTAQKDHRFIPRERRGDA